LSCRGVDANFVDFSDHFFSTPTALAQTRTAIPGKPLILYRAYSTNPDCTSGDMRQGSYHIMVR
jgi:hypothetical protein